MPLSIIHSIIIVTIKENDEGCWAAVTCSAIRVCTHFRRLFAKSTLFKLSTLSNSCQLRAHRTDCYSNNVIVILIIKLLLLQRINLFTKISQRKSRRKRTRTFQLQILFFSVLPLSLPLPRARSQSFNGTRNG